MAELEDKLNAILGDPQAMGQILSMARALSGGGESSPPPEEPGRPDPPPESEDSSDAPARPPGELGDLLGDLDPELLQKGLALLRAYRTGDDRREALLGALTPYLSPQRREKLERARRIVRLTRVAALALGLFRPGGEEEEHV